MSLDLRMQLQVLVWAGLNLREAAARLDISIAEAHSYLDSHPRPRQCATAARGSGRER